MRAIGRHQRAIAAPEAPVDLGVLIGVKVEDRDLIKFAAIDVGRHRVDHRIPAIAGFKADVGRFASWPPFGGLFSAIEKLIQRAEEVGALLRRKHIADRHGRARVAASCRVRNSS